MLFEQCCKSNGDRLENGQKCSLGCSLNNAARVMETGWEMARNVFWRLFEECGKSNGDRLGNGQKCSLGGSLKNAARVMETG
jgi:hypothetical protein